MSRLTLDLGRVLSSGPLGSPVLVSACVLSRFSRFRLFDPMDYSPPGLSVHGILQ